MALIDRFLPRIQKLPSYLQLRPGFTIVEETPKQFLLHSGTQSFEINLPFPGISLLDFFKQLSDGQTLFEILEAMSPFQINFLLDVAETLHHSGLLISSPKDSNGVDPRYIASANMFDQFRQPMPGESVKSFALDRTWQDRISTARVGLIGLGRVGSQLARLLTIAGVRNFTAVDDGLVDESLWYTDGWYFKEDRGEQRSEALARNLRTINSDIEFCSISTSLDAMENEYFPYELLEMDVVIVATDELRLNLYEFVNQACVKAGIPWTSYRTSWTGLTVELGPTVLPKETACYNCYQHRQQSNLTHPNRYQALMQALEQQNPPLLDIQITPCASLFCYEILRLLSREIPPLTVGAVMEFTIATAELVRHPLLKVPRCPTCRRDIRPFAPTRFWSEISPPGSPDQSEHVNHEPRELHPMD